MTLQILLLEAATFGLSYVLTRWVQRTAEPLGLIDIPNQRSSHETPTPRGGGIAIAIASLATMGILTALGVIPEQTFLAIGPGGAAVALVGFIDDIRPLSARIRLFVHFAAAAWAVAWIGPVTLLHTSGSDALVFKSVDDVLSTVGIVWFLNMYNFMDGIDGIAASQAVFMAAGLLLLSHFSVGIGIAAVPAAAVGAAAGGFLLVNWPPAKIFMGDVGSGYLGYLFAVLGLGCGAQSGVTTWPCLILAGVFGVDATVTVLRRFVAGERLAEPHRTHAFQHLAQKYGHRNVTLSVALVNVAWLLPCAAASVHWPRSAADIAVVAVVPLAIGAFVIGSGRPAPSETSAIPSADVIPFPSARRTPQDVRETLRSAAIAHPQASPATADRKLSDAECAN